MEVPLCLTFEMDEGTVVCLQRDREYPRGLIWVDAFVDVP